MNKIVFSVLVFIMSLSLSAQDSKESVMTNQHVSKDINWRTNFEEAKKIAKKKNKPILVFFTGSDWCGPCKMLQHDFFNTDEFKQLVKKDVILYEADFPRRTDIITPEQKQVNFKLQGKYGVRGYPTILFLDSDAKEVKRLAGYSFMRDPEPHFNLLKEIINTYSN